MKSRNILVAGILSVQALCGLAENQQRRLEAKEISIQDAQGGVQKLINRGLLKPVDDNKRNKARRMGAVKHSSTAKVAIDKMKAVHDQKTKSGRTGTPKGTSKTLATGRTEVANDAGHAVDEYYHTEYGNDADAPADDHYSDDYYYYGDAPVDDHYSDDYYYSGKGGKKGKKSGKKSGKGYYPDDDQYGDEPIATVRIPLLMEAFQDATSVTIVPVLSGLDDLTMPGTVFLYSDAPFQNKTLLGSGAAPSGVVQGSCTRTDPLTIGSVGYEGKAYCHFVYEFFDIDGQTVIATLTAEGPVENGDMSSLAVTGGSGELRRTIGQIDLYPSTVDFTVPPNITNDPSLDFLGDGMNQGYEMYAYLFVDPMAVLY